MWITGFALAIAGAVWLSAVNLAIQLDAKRSMAATLIESRQQPPALPWRQLSSTDLDVH